MCNSNTPSTFRSPPEAEGGNETRVGNGKSSRPGHQDKEGKQRRICPGEASWSQYHVSETRLDSCSIIPMDFAIKHKFKGKLINNFKIAPATHQIPCTGPSEAELCATAPATCPQSWSCPFFSGNDLLGIIQWC